MFEIPLVDDAVQHVGCIGRVREIPQLVDHQHMRVQKRLKGALQPPAFRSGVREPANERIGADEARLIAVLDGPVGDRDAEVRLPRPTRATQARAPSFAHRLGADSSRASAAAVRSGR